VAALFVGGIVPGALIGLGFMVAVAWRSRRIAVIATTEDDPRHGLGRTALRAVPALLVPVIILYGMLGGFVTVTEASVLAAAYVFLYGVLTRTVTVKALHQAAANSAIATGLFGFIIAAAGPFSFFLALYQAPQAAGNLLLSLSGGNADVLMLMVTGLLLILGCLVEATSLVIILAPILAATATVAGIDQLHMALVSITALMIGLFTPPVGTNLFAVVGISGEPIERVSRELVPFIVLAGVVVLALALTPALVTWLPNLIMK
jgi:tripartite ATP-independent transporter DctM subunit